MARRRGILVAALSALFAWSCTEEAPTAPNGGPGVPQEIDKSTVVAALSCNVDVTTKRVACGRLGENALLEPSGMPGEGDKANIIIGGQGVFVSVQTSNVEYDAGTGAFTFDATIRNLIAQPLGTADTIPPSADPDPSGIRIFVAGGPTVTSGTGTITVVGDGVDAFTGVDQPYYQYNAVLDQFEISSPKKWQLNIPNTVEKFAFALLVSAAVPRPDGYIDLQVANNTVTPPTDKPISFFVRNANGTLAANQTVSTWLSSDTTRATVDASGVINPLRAGQFIITAIASDGLRVGYLTVNVKSIRRTWTGLVSTDWHTRGNWSPDNVVPLASDTAVFADTSGATQWPLLTQNTQIAGVEVDDITPGGVIPEVNLGPFDLTVSGDVFTTNQGSISSTAGRLILEGLSNTIRGSVRNIRVPGRYSLDGNLTVNGGRIEVQSGRLQNTAFRIQFNNN